MVSNLGTGERALILLTVMLNLLRLRLRKMHSYLPTRGERRAIHRSDHTWNRAQKRCSGHTHNTSSAHGAPQTPKFRRSWLLVLLDIERIFSRERGRERGPKRSSEGSSFSKGGKAANGQQSFCCWAIFLFRGAGAAGAHHSHSHHALVRAGSFRLAFCCVLVGLLLSATAKNAVVDC